MSSQTLSALPEQQTQTQNGYALAAWQIVLICAGGVVLLMTGLFVGYHFINKRIRYNRAKEETSKFIRENKIYY